jgi:gentisate 1,2-dioxygenase
VVLSPDQLKQREEELEAKLKSLGVTEHRSVRANRPKDEPWVIHWRDVFPLFREAGELMGLTERVSRRHVGGYQLVMPGEIVPAHHHSANAMRFVVYGDGTAYTVTNGEQMFMEPRDLLVQPTLGWHHHGNEGSDIVAWRDYLDVHIMDAFQPEIFEDWEDGDIPPITQAEGTYARTGLFRAPNARGPQPKAVPIIYKWGEAVAALGALAKTGEDDPYDGILLEYRNPITGGATVPTMSARLQLLRPGQQTRTHRHSSLVRHCVVAGTGVTTVDVTDPVELRWAENDAFAIPTWRWHSHRNTSTTEPAIIFSVTDQPAYEALGFYREETR